MNQSHDRSGQVVTMCGYGHPPAGVVGAQTIHAACDQRHLLNREVDCFGAGFGSVVAAAAGTAAAAIHSTKATRAGRPRRLQMHSIADRLLGQTPAVLVCATHAAVARAESLGLCSALAAVSAAVRRHSDWTHSSHRHRLRLGRNDDVGRNRRRLPDAAEDQSQPVAVGAGMAVHSHV